MKHKGRVGAKAFAALLKTCRPLDFVPHHITQQLDQHSHYVVPMENEFPLHVSLFHVGPGHHTSEWNWHERLELTMALDGPLRMRMGDTLVELDAGDMVVVDNLKLHKVEEFPGMNTRVIVVSFMPDLVYGGGSSTFDYTFLLPFYSKREGVPHALRMDDDDAGFIYDAISQLIKRYFSEGKLPYYRAACKASLLEILYQLTSHFATPDLVWPKFLSHRQRSAQLSRLFEYVNRNYAQRITVQHAARLVNMSQARLTKIFKDVSGTTFVTHLNRVRLANAMRLMRETDLSITDIASRTGFSDQSYFDRRFKAATGKSPRRWRDGDRAN